MLALANLYFVCETFIMPSSYDDKLPDIQVIDTLAMSNVVGLHPHVSEHDSQQWPSHDQLTNASLGNNQLAIQDEIPLPSDHFIQRNGVEFAGTHLILDLWGATRLDELDHMESAMREAVSIAGATLLHIHLHHFTPNGGISGVAVLAESHISVHTWPERNFAAFDIFMCGDAEPEKAIPVLHEAFNPTSVNVSEHLRGTVLSEASNDDEISS